MVLGGGVGGGGWCRRAAVVPVGHDYRSFRGPAGPDRPPFSLRRNEQASHWNGKRFYLISHTRSQMGGGQ